MTTWTKEPPKEPGWYWCRVRAGCTAPSWNSSGFVYGWTWNCKVQTAVKRGYMWWPIPIQPPPTEQAEIEKALEEKRT